jgi:integrase
MRTRRKQTQLLFPIPAKPIVNWEFVTKLSSKENTNIIYLRDGEVVLYKHARSNVWQVRFKLFDRQWHRHSTKHYNLQFAKQVACEMYDEARFKERIGVPVVSRRFDAVANRCLQDIDREIQAGIKAHTNKDYKRVINKYLIPFFGSYMVDNINEQVVSEYEQWRNNEMGITPKASTLMTHASAYSRVIKSAIQRGWVSANSPIAFLNRRGKASTPRAGFTREEVHKLLAYLPEFSNGGHTELARDMRKLLRDYVEILIATGMRCGKESMNLQWKHVDWYDEIATGKRYLRLYVNGKTGDRQLIVRNFGIAAFERLAIRQKDLIAKNLNEAIKRKTTIRVFRLSDGTQPKSLHTTFKWLLHFAHLTYDAKTKQQRTLYSLRHAYATLALMDDAIDIHTLARQMGTSVGMLEKHYSKLTATMAAEKLA